MSKIKPSYKILKNNSKLTDFEGLRDAVVYNVVKGVPVSSKLKAKDNELLYSE